MYVKSIVLDGFKSYGQRTEITQFDSKFNAITGLNGTGKSNILDSICFVLGISNLSQVRVSSLQDFIYKNGQAGINKATVSVTFDNTNKNQSPLGFESYSEITITRQVVLGGKNKYMINGTTVQNKRVHDMFCSVQLNVNNPHFLIMQGRVTKVLNMKPVEILAMIEEAAGTRMYENKRSAALKVIEKKDAKLGELNSVLNEEISPKLERLREERRAYLEFKRIERELENMMRLFQGRQYIASQRATVEAGEHLEKGEHSYQKLVQAIDANKETCQIIDEEIKEMSKAAESNSGGKLQQLEAELKEKERTEAKTCAAEKAAKENITAEEKRKMQLEKNFKDDTTALKSKETELEGVQELFQKLKDNDAADNAALAVAQKKYEALSVGMEVNEAGETETLQAQLMNSRQEAAQASTDIKMANMQLNHCQTQLKEKQREFDRNSGDHRQDQATLEKSKHELHSLEQNLQKIKYSEERMTELQGQKRTLINESRGIQERTDRFYAQKPMTNFQYRNPVANFNKNSVKGVVCRLIKVQDSNNCVAIETAAGGRLYEVIIDSETTGKQLLKHGDLQRRTTFIPLNKVKGRAIDQRTVITAQNLVGKDNVQTALSLISYNSELQSAMEYIFGGVFVCKDLNVAQKIAFDKRIGRRCFTLDGDVVDPAGTLSGGARQKTVPLLIQLQEIEKYEQQHLVKEQQLQTIQKEIEQLLTSQDQWRTLKQQIELHENDLRLLTQRLQNTAHHRKQEEINNLKQNIVELDKKIKTSQEIEVKSNAKVKELEGKMKNSKSYRECQLKDAETEMKALKRKADKSRKEWEQREQEYEMLNLEITELKKGLENVQMQIQKLEENLIKLREEYEQFQNDAKEIKVTVENLHNKVKAEKSAITEKNKEVQKKVNKKEQIQAQTSEYELDIKKLEHEMKKLKNEYAACKAKEADIQKRLKDNNKLKEAEALSDKDARELEKRIRNAQETRTKLSRTVNAKAQNALEQEEKLYLDLLKRKRIVESDKKSLLTVISDLDTQKEQALLLAWEQVNKDFGSIFSTLLPGTNAKLQPPENKKVLDGLEVKVCLGGVWKESLNELSGGQRSLVALSLILAMLLFKPAPLYILDEVDAALDLSHTQNVGNMLKMHFKQSQFIIVSLKDGMFNNANVLFRTAFVDGMSAVTRTINRA